MGIFDFLFKKYTKASDEAEIIDAYFAWRENHKDGTPEEFLRTYDRAYDDPTENYTLDDEDFDKGGDGYYDDSVYDEDLWYDGDD